MRWHETPEWRDAYDPTAPHTRDAIAFAVAADRRMLAYQIRNELPALFQAGAFWISRDQILALIEGDQ